MNSGSRENLLDGEDKKSIVSSSANKSSTTMHTNETNKDISSEKNNSLPYVNSDSVADGIVHIYQAMSKRKTPRVGTLFFSSIKRDRESRTQSLGAIEGSVTHLNSGGSVLTNQHNENSGLDKYNRYMQTHSGLQTATTFKNLGFRKIVGQEDNTDNINVKTKLLTKEDKERKLTSRPPVVGQASSSSNDSGSSALDHHSPSIDTDENSCDEMQLSRFSEKLDLNGSAYFKNSNDQNQGHIISNREDYINEKPPEGSSEQESTASQPDLQTELPRIPSPSSASSVASASVRPLEWDSGADVGYYQTYPPSNPDSNSKFSTIERIALATGSAALLVRSDPEGTTEQGCIVASKSLSNKAFGRKQFLRDRVGAPVAESTPFSSTIVSTPQTGEKFFSPYEEELSPIIEQKNNPSLSENVVQSTDNINNLKKTGNSQHNMTHFSLFPELQSKNENIQGCIVQNSDGLRDNIEHLLSSRSVGASNSLSPERSDEDVKWHSLHKHFSEPTNKFHVVPSKDDFPLEKPQQIRKFSCSMELLHVKSNLNEREQSNTLPRSQSHNSIVSEANIDNINSLPKSLILRSFNPVKSVSSSSVSTVVHKKKDSPKVISKLVQTSCIQQSVGTQACGTELIQQPFVPLSSELSDGLSELHRERSNYFGLPTSDDIGGRNFENYEGVGSQFHSRHAHNGIPCSGAHKKISTSDFNVAGEDSPKSNHIILGHEFQNNLVISDFQKAMENCNTLESVESSARSVQNNLWMARRESMGVEDRVNSFEYLPGHVFENSALKRNGSQGTGTSSVSLNRNESFRNEYSDGDGTDRLWDTSASSTLMRDIERGVSLMSDFVRQSNVNDDHLKQKLIKKVVEKLLKTEYPEDKSWHENLKKGWPWMPKLLHNKAEIANGRETRRSHNKEIPLNDVSTSEKSSSRISSNGFQSQNAFVKQHSETAEKCIGTDDAIVQAKEFIFETKCPSVPFTSSNAIIESGSSSVKPKSTADEFSQYKSSSPPHSEKSGRNEIRQSINYVNRSTYSSSCVNSTDRSDSVDCSGDWRAPVTEAEKLFEEKRKKQERLLKDHGKNHKASAVLFQYLNIERENQLFWIKNEIDHLSHLKCLLEKQEELKKSLTRIKKQKTRSALTTVNKPKNSSDTRSYPEKRFHRLNSGYVPRESCELDYKKENEIPEETSDWSSHNYFNCTENKVKKYAARMKNNKGENVNLSPNELKRKLKKINLQSIPPRVCVEKKLSGERIRKGYATSLDNDDDDDENEKNLHLRKTVGTETTGTVGVQTSKSVQQLPVIKPDWYKNHKKSMKRDSLCYCKKSLLCKYCEGNQNKEVHNNKSVAYFITFGESSQQGRDKSKEKNAKDRTKNYLLSKTKTKERHTNQSVATTDEKYSSCSCENSEQKENCEPNCEIKTKHPTLQDYLLKNRADYVNRAEYRRRCVAELAYLRELRDKSKRHLITMAPESSDYSQSSTPRDLPPPPLAVKRVFSQKTMRRQTERKYRQLAEVKSRQLDMKRKESYRTNRLMAEVFTKKLQRRTLKGEVNLSNSVSVISSI